MTQKDDRRRPCYACEAGVVVPTNLRDEVLPYRDEPDLVIDRDLVVPRCDQCGELWLRAADTQRLNAVLEELRLARKREAAESFVAVVEERYPDVPRAAWEETLGLSRGYLSRLTSGKKVADTPLEILLAGFAKQPELVLGLLASTRALPPAVAAVCEGRGRKPRRA